MARTEKQSSTSAKVLYQPVGLASSLAAGLIASAVFRQIWKRATPGDTEDPPKALESEYGWREILVAAAIQGAIFAVVKAIVSRSGAKTFERLTGEWPGD